MRYINLKSEIFGYLLGDGWISNRNLNCGFSGDRESLEKIKNDLIYLFGDIGAANIKVYKTESKKYGISGETNRFICNKKVAKQFVMWGAPIGKRVEQNYCLPDWIINGDFDVKRSFMSGLYAAEGYKPRFAKNNKSLATMGFNMSKRADLDKDLFISQYSKILTDLGIKFSVNVREVFTCKKNNKIEFVFSNSTENTELVTRILNPRYSKEKYDMFNKINLYYGKKIEILNYLKIAKEYSLEHLSESSGDVAKKFNVTSKQIYSWRKNNTDVRLPQSFPTFDEFIYSSPCGLL